MERVILAQVTLGSGVTRKLRAQPSAAPCPAHSFRSRYLRGPDYAESAARHSAADSGLFFF